MLLEKGKKIFLIIGTGVLPAAVAGALFAGSTRSFNPSKADAYQTVLNSTQQPVLNSSGNGTMVRSTNNVTWEYHNAQDYANGHVSLKNGGYFGVSQSSAHGITGISNITVNYSSGSDGELWLLTSTDGTTWHERELLKDTDDTSSTSASSTLANNWRYVRFWFNYDTHTTPLLNINSVVIDYGCSGISAPEDVDSAHDANVIETTGLSHGAETSSLSPNSVGGEAVRFTKTGSGSTTLTIGFGQSYTLKNVAYRKIEFDIWTQNINYGKTIEVLNSDGSYTSSKHTAASGLHSTNPSDSYVWTSLGNSWYHAELPITTIVSLISGYGTKDLPSQTTLNKQFDAIRINAGNCVIDNLRLGSSVCELGIYNSSTYKPSIGEMYWVKTSWAGKLYAEGVEITFSDDTLARHIPLTDSNIKNGSPFYIELLGSGTLTIYVSVVCGYNRVTKTVSKTITVQ